MSLTFPKVGDGKVRRLNSSRRGPFRHQSRTEDRHVLLNAGIVGTIERAHGHDRFMMIVPHVRFDIIERLPRLNVVTTTQHRRQFRGPSCGIVEIVVLQEVHNVRLLLPGLKRLLLAVEASHNQRVLPFVFIQ